MERVRFSSSSRTEQVTDNDVEDSRRSLPACLFGPDMSLRHVPQFPGGRKLAALLRTRIFCLALLFRLT